VFVCVCVYVCMYVCLCVYVCMYVCLCVYVCMYVCMYVCVVSVVCCVVLFDALSGMPGCVGGCDEILTDLFELDRRSAARPLPPRAPLHQRLATPANGQQRWCVFALARENESVCRVNHSSQVAKRGRGSGSSRGGGAPKPVQFTNTTQSFSELRGGGGRGSKRKTGAATSRGRGGSKRKTRKDD